MRDPPSGANVPAVTDPPPPPRRQGRPPESGWELGAGGLTKVAWGVVVVLLIAPRRPPAGGRLHGLWRDHPRPGRRRRRQPALSGPPPPDPEALAEALRATLPDAEPFEVDADRLAAAVAAAGADPADDALVAAALVAWESLLI